MVLCKKLTRLLNYFMVYKRAGDLVNFYKAYSTKRTRQSVYVLMWTSFCRCWWVVCFFFDVLLRKVAIKCYFPKSNQIFFFFFVFFVSLILPALVVLVGRLNHWSASKWLSKAVSMTNSTILSRQFAQCLCIPPSSLPSFLHLNVRTPIFAFFFFCGCARYPVHPPFQWSLLLWNGSKN